MKQSQILAVAGIVMLILFYITSTSREGLETATFVANEGQPSVSLENGTKFKYGADTRWNYKTIDQGWFKCDNATFGDPAYGTRKACYKVIETPDRAAAASTPAAAASTPAATASSSTASSSPVVTNGAVSPPLPWSETKMYVTGDTMTLNGKTYIALHNNDHMGPTNNQFTIYWTEYVRPPPPPPAPTPASLAAATSISGMMASSQSALSSAFGSAPTLAGAAKSVGDTAANTYNSFGSVISSGIAKFGLVLVVGASIVIGVIVVWALWNTFIGRPATAAPPGFAPMIGAPPARW